MPYANNKDGFSPSYGMLFISTPIKQNSSATSSVNQFSKLKVLCINCQSIQSAEKRARFLIGLDSYSRQVFIYLDPILIYISLWIDCLFEIRKIAVFPLAFIAGWFQCHWWGFISRNYVVWPTFLLMNVFIALKGSHFWFLFDFTAAGVVPCGGRKTSPRTSTIVQFIFYIGPLRSAIIFWEIRNKWLV